MIAEFSPLDFTKVPSPCHLLHRGLLEKNLRVLKEVQDRSGAKILLALKGFAQFSEFPLISRYLAGTTASGINEALLGYEEFGKEVHVYSPAFKDDELEHLLLIADHISFNSPAQWAKFRERVKAAPRKVSCGMRVNPEYAEVEVDLYNPCALGSRLGAPRDAVRSPADLDGLEGLHFHTMCQQNSDTLARTIPHFEAKFGEFIPGMKWINFGGGHHITRADYDLDLLVKTIRDFRAKWGSIFKYTWSPARPSLSAPASSSPPCSTTSTTPAKTRFWIQRPRRPCRTRWRCRTARTSPAAINPARRRTPTGSRPRPASPATSSAITPSTPR